jgi:hypothetical protein
MHSIKILQLLNLIFLAGLMACQPSEKKISIVTVSDYRVFYDGQDQGYTTISGHFVNLENSIQGLFTGGPVVDMTTVKGLV